MRILLVEDDRPLAQAVLGYLQAKQFSVDWAENLQQARKLMQQHDLHRVIVVSDPLHMSRALRLSRELGIDALGSPTPSTRFRTVQTQWRFLLQEVYFFHRDLVRRAA